LDQLAEVARLHTKRKVTALRDISPEQFKAELLVANSGAAHYIVNFHRKPIFTMGGGHHSPIGGYLEAEDLVLVLDVNENYKPWLISREKLYAAMDTLDGDKKRGLLRFD
jgi:L-ascorbate metabolism protein UlaG (beta-lactamase superfamily)